MKANHREKLKHDWEERERLYSNSKRAVLSKRLPSFLNNYIHTKHIQFIQHSFSGNARTVLDVGCGYGRISEEVRHLNSGLSFNGVELCSGFAQQYETNIGPCFYGSIEEFSSSMEFDCILCVTLLMYIDKTDLPNIVNKLWGLLSNGGTLIVIEPASEILRLWRKLTMTHSASPTGGEVLYFNLKELTEVFAQLPSARVKETFSLKLIPFISSSAIHHGLSIQKI